MNREQEQPLETKYTDDKTDMPGPANSDPKAPPSRRSKPGMPAWTLALLILTLTGVLIWAGDALFRSRQRIPDVVPKETASVRPSATPTIAAAPASPTPTLAATPASPTPKPTVRVPAQGSRTAQARRLALSEPTDTRTRLCTPIKADTASDLELAIEAYQQADLERATSWFSTTLAIAETDTTDCRPLLVHLYLYLGNLAALDDEYETALDYYQASMDLAGNAADQSLLYANQASIYYAQGHPEAALDAVNSALELAPEHANAYFHRATAYRALDLNEEAKQDLDRAIQLDPKHARAHASRGLYHHNASAFDAALEDYARSLELDPDAAEVYLNRGGTYATMGELDAALLDYSQALVLQPEDAEAYYNRGTVYAIQERYPEALQDLNQALEIRPDFAQVYGNRGLIYKAMGVPEAAIADLERFMELADNPEWKAMIEQHLAELKQGQE